MIDRGHDLPISKQAEVLRISRGSVYYLPRPVPEVELAIMRRLDRLHLEFPFAGSRMLRGLLAAEGCKIGRRHVMRHEDFPAFGHVTNSEGSLFPQPPRLWPSRAKMPPCVAIGCDPDQR